MGGLPKNLGRKDTAELSHSLNSIKIAKHGKRYPLYTLNMVNMPTSGAHTDLIIFFYENAQNIALNSKVVLVFVKKDGKPPGKSEKHILLVTALLVLKLFRNDL